MLHLFVFPVFCLLCFPLFARVGNLYPFEVATDVHVRVCVCVLRTEIERQRVQILPSQDGCFPNAECTAGQLFSVKETNKENASRISDYFYCSSAEKRKRINLS